MSAQAESSPTTPVVDSVEALDRLIDEGYIPPGDRTAPHPFDACFLAASPIQTRLRRLLQLYGAHPTTDQFFASTKDFSAVALERNPQTYLKKHAQTLAQINYEQHGVFARGAVHHFLDLGCSPGGFSSWTLRCNPDATGIGIAVPDHESRWKMVVEGTHLAEPRYELRYENVASLVRGFIEREERPIITPQQLPLDSVPKSFDFVIGGYTPMVGPITWKDDALHLLSKVLVLLSNIQPGGHAIIMTSTKTFRWIVEVIKILRHCFASMSSSKGLQLYSQRSSCFLVCRGFCATEEQVAQYTAVLRSSLLRLWAAVEAQDDDSSPGPVSDEAQEDEDAVKEDKEPVDSKFELRMFESLTDDQVFEAEFPYVLELFEPVWQIQFESVYRGFVKSLTGEEPDAYKQSPTSPTSPSWRIRAGRHTDDRTAGEDTNWVKGVAGASPIKTNAFPWTAKPPSPTQGRGKWQIPARRESVSNGDSGFGNGWRGRSWSQGESPTGFKQFDLKKPTGAADDSSSWRTRAT